MQIAIIVILVIVLAVVCIIFMNTKNQDAQKIKDAEKAGFERGVAHRKKEEETVLGTAEQKAQEKIKIADSKLEEAERKLNTANQQLKDAEEKAENRKKEVLLEAKDEIYKLRQEAEKEIRDRRSEVSKQERRIHQKEETLDKKIDSLEHKEELIQEKLKNAEVLKEEAEAVKQEQMNTLERISELTKEQAKEYMLHTLEDELVHEKAIKISSYEQQLKEECEEKARGYLSLAIAKCASDQVSEATVSVVALPSDEMKGRIIGREGRNIRTLETLTGVDLIIDDTPEAITLSCFDQVRREIARIALERLISDGRIHPSRIEETVEKAKREVEHKIKQEGERAVIETNVHGLNHELVKLLGRLRFRTSYRQNVLTHSIEVANLCGVLASELGVDVNLAKRAGLLHDIGKALTSEVEGSHVQIGVDVCKKLHENPEVIHAIEAHHGDVEPKTAIACIVQAADAVSAARPGARSENYESYIKRLEKLEEICMSYKGIEKCYAVQAGREIRVMVQPEVISDEKMVLTARQIAQQIESEMEYPGQIKVNLIRESRVADYAK
ncbi:MAG: ribonuclease Y [Oscillospiraceae bacterium]|nr:ribonuclease Y [Oscillospiraceae bacterium]